MPRATGLVVALTLLTLVLPAAAPAASSRLILSPQSGARVQADPLPITVRAPYGERGLKVTLNGQDITGALSDPDRRGRRTLRASASHGVRYGRNVVRVRRTVGGRVVRARSTFTLSRARPLVGAGVDRTVPVGVPTRLNARASRSRRAPKPAAGARAAAASQPGTPAGLRMTWRLLRRPGGSSATLQQPALLSLVQPLDNLLKPTPNSGPQPARPLIAPDKPGRYVAALTVNDGGVQSLVDTVTLTAVMPTPLVPVDTAATVEGQRGMAVGYHPAQQGGRAPQQGEAFYPLSSGNALQVVVLDRASLETVANQAYPASLVGIDEAAEYIGQYDDSKLVLVTAWADPGWRQSPFPAATNLVLDVGTKIGASNTSLLADTFESPLVNGQMTFIGVPGFPAGGAWETWGTPQDGARNTLDGFLSPDNNDNYAYLGTAPQPFDLGADGQSVTMQVGPTSYTASLPAGQGGFTALYLDGSTLQPQPGGMAGQATYQTANADGSPNLGEMQRMASDLQTAQDKLPQLLVVVRSIGAAPLARMGLQPPNYVGPFNGQYAGALNGLADAVAGVGGQAQWIWGMATAPVAQNSYSLVGRGFLGASNPSIPQGRGTDLGSAASPAPSSTHLRGLLRRDHRQHYAPSGASNAPFGTALSQLALAEPTPWPGDGNPDQQAAILCIGLAAGLGPNPRSQYWTLDADSSTWQQYQQAIGNVKASQCPAVTVPTDFTGMQTELQQEIGWLIKTKSYIGSLTQPFTDDGLSSYADLQTLTNNVLQAVKPPPAAKAGFNIFTIFGDIANLGDVFDVPGTGVISGIFTLAGDLYAPGQQGPTTDWTANVTTASDQLGGDMAQAAQDIAGNGEKLVDIIAADYTKLSTVGQLGGCAASPTCPREWQFTQDDQNAVSRAYEITVNREAWGGLLPAAYPYVLETSSNTNSYNGTFEGPQEQISGIGCDFAQPFPVSSPVFLRVGIRQTGNTPFLVFSNADFKGANSTTKTFPPTSLLTSPTNLVAPFAALDPGGNPSKGGLGLDEYAFMTENWPYTTGAKKPTTPVLKPWRGC